MKTLSRLASIVLLCALMVIGAGPAWAIPEGGASPDTPGTSASVSPQQLAAGERLSFRASGFPAGEIVYIKIDDGTECDAAAVHGACVYHQQKISSSGSVSGSFTLPSNLRPGAHWLRFLASEPIVKDGQQVGIKGYTARGSSDFTIVATDSRSGGGTPGSPGGSGSTGSQGSNGSNGSTTSNGSSDDSAGGAGTVQAPADGTAAGAVVEVKPDAAKPTTAPTATAAPAGGDASPVAATPAEQVSAGPSDGSGFPWVGVLGFVGLVALSFVGTRLAMSRRQ